MVSKGKENVEMEVKLDESLIILDKAVPVQKSKGRYFVHLKVEDAELHKGTLEIWVREVR